MKIIAYLASEIPALSATFVYNEILGLQEKGYIVVPISVHVPSSPVKEDRVAVLANQTRYLYQEGFLKIFLANIIVFFTSPIRYLKGAFKVLNDAIQCGIFNRIGCGLFYRFFFASRVARILKKKKCEHLHSNFAHIPTDIAMYAAILADVPFSFTSHANDLFERGWLLPQKIARSKFAVTISEFNQKYLSSLGGQGKKIHIVRCGVDSKAFSARPFAPCSPTFKIGTLGRMVEKKGFDVLLRAASILQKKNVAFQLVIAGSGPLEGALENLSIQLGLESVVDFIGPLSHENVPLWLRNLDLFVLPCQKDANGDMDGIPVVLMEAMLSGVPVISTRLSGIPELIEHKKEGLLVEQKSPDDLASAMLLLLHNDALRKQFVENGIKKVKNEFDLEMNIQRMIELFGAYSLQHRNSSKG